jgi:hypothetical protein
MEVEVDPPSVPSFSAFLNTLPAFSLSKKIAALCEKLSSKNSWELIPCLVMLKQCLKDRNGVNELISAGSVYKLLMLCHSFHTRDEDVVLHALVILCRVANGSSSDKAYLKKEGVLDTFRSALEHDSDAVRQQACIGLEYYCHESLALRDEILELEVVPLLIEISQKNSKLGPLRSALSLMNALCKGPVHPDPSITIGFFPILMDFLRHGDDEIQACAISGITIMARYSIAHEDMAQKILMLVPQLISVLATEEIKSTKKLSIVLDALLEMCSKSKDALTSATQNNLLVLIEPLMNHEKLAVRHPATKLYKLVSDRRGH